MEIIVLKKYRTIVLLILTIRTMYRPDLGNLLFMVDGWDWGRQTEEVGDLYDRFFPDKHESDLRGSCELMSVFCKQIC